jgi:hypothetical protein
LKSQLGSARRRGEALHPQVAARKIAIWWRFLIPRRRLCQRMVRRGQVKEILLQVVEVALHQSALRTKRKHRMLRNGAAITIQRWLRRKVLGRRKAKGRRSLNYPRSRSDSHGLQMNTVCEEGNPF